MKHFLAIASLLCTLLSSALGVEISSPNSLVTLDLRSDAQEGLLYRVRHDGRDRVAWSRLGLRLGDSDLGAPGTTFDVPAAERIDRTVEVVGPYATTRLTGTRLLLQAMTDGQSWTVEAIVTDTAVALRYVVEGAEGATRTLHSEPTEFVLPDDATVWHSGDNYEGVWRAERIRDLAANQTMAFPLVVEESGHYTLITTAANLDYPAVYPVAGEKGRFSLGQKGTGGTPGKNELPGTVATSWRVILLANDLNELVNNGTVYALAPEPDPEVYADTGWIRPGYAAWSWVTKGLKGQNPTDSRLLIDQAAVLGWTYAVIDDGWEHWDDKWETLEALCRHANQQGVGVIVWKPTNRYQPEWQKKVLGFTPEPIEGVRDAAGRRAFFARCRQAGVAGVKVDFVGEADLGVVNFYRDCLLDAARERLVINFHGASLPSGLSRTFPNELTREAVRGMEHSHKDEDFFAGDTILPFTRYVVGPGDFTPLSHASPRRGTRAHQLATLIAFVSPMNVLAADPARLRDSPYARFVTDTPTTWDATRVLAGSEIGKLAVMARRKGKDWWLGVVNGIDEQEIVIDLSEFLDDGPYMLTEFRDGSGGHVVGPTVRPISANERLTLSLGRAGGYAAVLRLGTGTAPGVAP